jgi:hypothetical protein
LTRLSSKFSGYFSLNSIFDQKSRDPIRNPFILQKNNNLNFLALTESKSRQNLPKNTNEITNFSERRINCSFPKQNLEALNQKGTAEIATSNFDTELINTIKSIEEKRKNENNNVGIQLKNEAKVK